MSILDTERELYKKQWSTGYVPSACALPVAEFISRQCTHEDRILEVGCGDCTSMNYLNPRGFTVIGCDIAPNRSDVIECPAWSMPFADKQFDVTYSTDVLEHFPTDLVDIAIAEILRVTKHKSIHVVATFDHVRNGEVLHKSVYPIEWWKEKFAKLNTQGIELVIKDREPFLKEMGSNAV